MQIQNKMKTMIILIKQSFGREPHAVMGRIKTNRSVSLHLLQSCLFTSAAEFSGRRILRKPENWHESGLVYQNVRLHTGSLMPSLRSASSVDPPRGARKGMPN